MKKYFIFFLSCFIVHATICYSQTHVEINIGDSQQFTRTPMITFSPVTNVTASITGPDSEHVFIHLDSWERIFGSLVVETKYTLAVKKSAPVGELEIRVLLTYDGAGIIDETLYEDFIIKADSVVHSIEINPGDSQQFTKTPLIPFSPVTNVTASITGPDSENVFIHLDSWKGISGTLNIETKYTLAVKQSAPVGELEIRVLLTYDGAGIIDETLYEDFIIKADSVVHSIEINPGDSQQFTKTPLIPFSPVTNVTASITGPDSEHVSINLDSWEKIPGTFNIETKYTLSINQAAPLRVLQIVVTLTYDSAGVHTETFYDDFNIKTGFIVHFNDVILEQEIRNALGKPSGPITELDMHSFDYALNANYKGIKDLTGLESAVNLQRLSLIGNEIEDISPLSGLDLLWYLNLGKNSITTLDPLSGLLNLKELHLFQCYDLTDITALTDLTNLEILRLGECDGISEINSLANLENLKELDLFAINLGGKTGVLSNLTNLQKVDLSSAGIDDIKALENLVKITDLRLQGNLLEDDDLVNLYNLDKLSNMRWGFNEYFGYLDLRWNTGFSEGAIRDLADNLAIIDYDHILYDVKTSVIDNSTDMSLPREFKLSPNYPNPFNPGTVISYQLPKESNVEMSIYNTTGQIVATLVKRSQPPGNYTYEWNASHLPGGMYLCRFQASDFVQTIKLILLK